MTSRRRLFNRSELPFIRNVERPAAGLGPQGEKRQRARARPFAEGSAATHSRVMAFGP